MAVSTALPLFGYGVRWPLSFATGCIVMRILGIDPGYALVGWGVIDIVAAREVSLVECGVIETSKEKTLSERLSELFNDLNQLVAEFSPHYAGIETLLFSKNVKTAMLVSEARGVVRLLLQQHAIPICEVNPMQVKNSISGYGKADKKQIQENVRIICGLDSVPKPDDAADAVAIAITTYDYIKNIEKIR